jgi:predicted nucleotidyltransferase
MDRLVEENLDKLIELCRRFQVRRIELFGSATGDHFDPDASDLDFLVTFEEMEPNQYADAYFGLLEGLQKLFDRPIDLVMTSAIKNPYFLSEVEKSRTLLYAA